MAGRNGKMPRSYSYVVTGVDVDGHPFRLETNYLALAKSMVPWRGTLWSVEADGTRRMMARYRQGQPTS